jgi:hypothetical protein
MGQETYLKSVYSLYRGKDTFNNATRMNLGAIMGCFWLNLGDKFHPTPDQNAMEWNSYEQNHNRTEKEGGGVNCNLHDV